MKIRHDTELLKKQLYPFTSTRQAMDIRIGILTIREKWELLSGNSIGKDGSILFNNNSPDELPAEIDGNLIPTALWMDGHSPAKTVTDPEVHEDFYKKLSHPWQIFRLNDWAIRQDFELITHNRISNPLAVTNRYENLSQIFIEEGAKVSYSILNASEGPIYIGKDATIMEGCVIRGPFAMCEGSVLKMGTKVYGATTLGPHCMGGGEIKNSMLMGYSNKAHDGYLGDSVLGEWCNLGAGTSCSNIKNTASLVKSWSQVSENFETVGLKCGLMMGDYSRSAINTSFNTGTTVGICCNVFGEGYPPKHVRDFTWGKENYNIQKAFSDISNWKKLKGLDLGDEEQRILSDIYHSMK